MNVLMITYNDPAGMAIAFTNAINRYSQHNCRLITIADRYGINFEKDIHLPDIHDDDFSEIEYLLKNADIIHFHLLMDENTCLGPLVIRDFIDGKEIIHHHHGHPDFLINVEKYNEKYRQLGRRILVSTPDLLQITHDALWLPNIVPLNDVLFQPRYEQMIAAGRIKVCQAPTRKYDKHTQEFVSVMERLVSRYSNVESMVIERTTYEECLLLKRGCHIIFDHMRGWFGISSLESLCHGKPVIAGLDEWNISCIKKFTGAEKLPWIIARDENQLESILEDLILDDDKRKYKGEESRRFMEECWSEGKVVGELINFYQQL